MRGHVIIFTAIKIWSAMSSYFAAHRV